jgi:DNA-binding NtrC family response regulator
MNGSSSALIVSSDPESRSILRSILEKEGLHAIQASGSGECLELLPTQNVGLVFCERRLVDGTYRELITATRMLNRKVPVIVTSRLADWDEYLEALRYGAFDLIASPCQPNDVFWALKQIEREEQERAASLYPSQSSARPSGEATL